MTEIIKTITLDLSRRGENKVLFAKQSDINSRRVKIKLTDSGTAYIVPQNATALITAERSDGESAALPAEVLEDGTVAITLGAWPLAIEGEVKCAVTLIGDGDMRLTSANFFIEVEATPYSDDDILEDESYTLVTQLISEMAAINYAEEERKRAENQRAEAAQVLNEALQRTNAISETLENKLAAGELKGEKGDEGDKGDKGDAPVRGVDYWTPDDVDSMESILRAKAANIGGFVPVTAPLWESGADVSGTTATVSDVLRNADSSYTVTFNRAREYFDDGGFEMYGDGESIVPLQSYSKGENGWSGLNFGIVDNQGELRVAKVHTTTAPGESHSGSSYIEVWGRYTSLCKSLKLKPKTKYTLSFWQKGFATAKFNNISIAAKAYDGDVIYTTSSTGAHSCDVKDPRYEVLYNRGDGNVMDAVIQDTGVWQEFRVDFETGYNEYVDIFIYFGDNSWQYFYFDDFSVKETVGEEFSATYAAGTELPPEVKAGAVFYVERDKGRAFTRFEYASSYAIKELYQYVESMSKSAYAEAVDHGFEGTEEEWLASLVGTDGKDGTDGKSAYELAVEKGFEGSVNEWLESLKGYALTTADKSEIAQNVIDQLLDGDGVSY